MFNWIKKHSYWALAIVVLIVAVLAIGEYDWDFRKIKIILDTEKWDSGWFQAVGSICAVLVAIYVPWKIDRNKRLADERRDKELERLSLKAIGHETWLMKEFFRHSSFAIGREDQAALEDFSAETAPIDPKSPFVMEHGKFEMVAKLPDEIATAYMNALSRRFLAINYMRSLFGSLSRSDSSADFSRGLALQACREGKAFCDEILEATKAECAGLRFGLRPGGYDDK